MKRFSFFIGVMSFLLFFSLSTFGQEWAKTFWANGEDKANAIYQTQDGGYIVAGYNKSFYSSYDIYVLKLSSDGTIEWQKIFAGSKFNTDIAHAIQQTQDGGYIIVGETTEETWGGFIWILKLSSDGTVEWQKTYGDYNKTKPYAKAYAIQQTKDGGYIVAGKKYSYNKKRFFSCVLKLTSDGSIEWQKTYRIDDYSFYLDEFEAYDIQQTQDGGFIVTNGYFKGNWILKLSSNGTVEWQKTYRGGYWDNEDKTYVIQQTKDGGYIVAGYTNSFGAGNKDIWILKLSSDGAVEWQKTYGGSNNDVANAIEQTKDGGYIVAGYTNSFGNKWYDIWVLKLASDGNILDQNCTGIIKDSNATVMDTNAIINNTHDVLVIDSNIQGKNSSAKVSEPDYTEQTQCYVSGNIPNIHPNTPLVPSGLNNGYIGESYTFTISTTDTTEDNVSYKFDWGDGTTSDWGSGIQSHSWNSAGTYCVKVQAKDSYDATSNYSDCKYITISELNTNLNRCNSNHIELCTSESECEQVGGYWDLSNFECKKNTSISKEPEQNNAAPNNPLPAVLFKPGEILPNSSDNKINVVASSSVYLQPSLKVDSGDVGKTATLVLYIYISSIHYGFMVPTKTVTLESEQKFLNLPKTLDFSDAVGMTFDVYYGYRIGKTLKYNAYRVTVVEKNVVPDCSKYTDASSCSSNSNCRIRTDFFGNFRSCILNCDQYNSESECKSAFDGNSCEWSITFGMCSVK